MSADTLERPTERKRRRGGPAPYGWAWDGNRRGGRQVEVPEEQHVRWLMLLLHRRGMTLRQVVAHLEQLGIRTRAGAPWSVATVARIVNGQGMSG